MMSPREDVLADISTERNRQEALKLNGRFRFTCADLEMSDAECCLVLMEEVGEVSRAILEQMTLANDRHHGELRKELIQVAAVCVAWVEALDKGRAHLLGEESAP